MPLKDSVENYSSVTICYVMDSTVYDSVTVPYPQGRWASGACVRVHDGIFIAGINFYLDGTKITRGSEVHTFGHAQGNVYVSNTVDIKVVKVIGIP